MNYTTFLAQVIGIFALVSGLSLIINKKLMLKVGKELIKNDALMLLGGYVNLLLGLFLVLTHNIWAWPTDALATLVTLVAWLILIKGGVRLLVPDFAAKSAKLFLADSWYWPASIIWLLIGAYLTYIAFGFTL